MDFHFSFQPVEACQVYRRTVGNNPLTFDDGAYTAYADDSDDDEISVETDDEASDADQPQQQSSSSDVQAPAKSPPKKFSKSQNRYCTWLLLEHQNTQHMFMKLQTSTVQHSGFESVYVIFFCLSTQSFLSLLSS